MSDWLAILEEFPVPPPAPTLPGRIVPRVNPPPRAILFDIYGTLLCPLARDLAEHSRVLAGEASFVAVAERFGFSREVGSKWHEWFYGAIAEEHHELEGKGLVPAEVLVEQIWAEMISRVSGDPALTPPKMLAAYREMLANPVRPFAGAAESLRKLKSSGIRLGLVSNSQFYSLPILGRYLDLDVEEFFEPRLTFLSYRLGFAKPAPCFFRLVRTRLILEGLRPEEALVVGDDLGNDVLAAQAHGLQAFLFTGRQPNLSIAQGKKEISFIPNYESLVAACLRKGGPDG